MNGRPLTEDQISQALRAHLPKQAQAGLHERILVGVDTTAQQRALPSLLGVLQDADPGARRRNLLIAAALLIALAIAAAAAAGAWRAQRDVAPDLSLLPPADLRALPSPSAPSAAPTPSAVTSPAGVWIGTGTMGTPRSGHTAVRLLDGRVLVAGGSSGPVEGADPNEVTSAELYDPVGGTWSATGDMVHPYAGFPATLLLDGRVLVGDTLGEDRPSGAEVYDPESGTWTATGKVVNGGGSTATLLRDGRVLVIGYSDTAEVYDPDTGTWTATGKMTDPRHSHAAILLPDGDVLVAGGHAPGDQPTASAELFDPDTGTWTAIASMNAMREAIEAFLRPDGKVLVLGSSRGDRESAELYDPTTGTWTATGGTSRLEITGIGSATVLSDDMVLMLSSAHSADAELYDLRTGSWTTAGTMLGLHSRAPAMLLLDGTVLVAGGMECSGADLTCVHTGASELYVPAGVSPPLTLATPAPTPIPTPTPVPTASPTPYPPAVGPVPSGARPWKVTVVNDSSKPATLFLAEEDESGLARLCGSVLPSVVPPGATVKVTFLLPPKGVKTCWIWVNPVPGGGGSLFQTSDAPLKGEIFIMADGQGGWLGR